MLPAVTTLVCSAVWAGGDDAVQRAAEVARAKLAAELGVAPDTVRVTAVAPMEWPDSSLGCPQKGGHYRAVLTSGHRVELESEGRGYAVHVAGTRAVTCRTSSAEPRIVAATRLAQVARRDLAARLNIDPDTVKTRSVQAQSWPDRSLGCPKPGVSYAQVVTPGFVIELQVVGRTYRYHSDLSRVVPCD